MRALFGERGVVYFSLLGRSKLCIYCGVRDVGDVAVFGEILQVWESVGWIYGREIWKVALLFLGQVRCISVGQSRSQEEVK